MRRLLYVPIIHEESDIGAAGKALAQSSRHLAGAGRWEFHKETVRSYWENVATRLRSVGPRGVKVFQDGLTVGGELGERIVAEAARTGSRNYGLLLGLIGEGAQLQATEDRKLLLKERDILRARLQGGPPADELHSYALDRLLEQRDRYIAASINRGLGDDELGVLFIGAQHEVAPYLAPDITVEMVVDPHMVRTYIAELFSGQDDGQLEEVSQRLTGRGPDQAQPPDSDSIPPADARS